MIQLHGGNIQQLPGILDFSANISPLGMPEGVREAAIRSIDSAESYPDPYCVQLRQRIGETEDIPPENIVCGNGAADLIFRIVHAMRPGRALVCAPCFLEYERALTETGCRTDRHILRETEGFRLTERILTDLTPDTDICFLCTPNNPTGLLIEPELLGRIAHRCAEKGILLVCDECFMGFTEKPEEYSLRRFLSERTVILRAFTKLFAMPGLRLGYALCGSQAVADAIAGSGQFWSVSSPAQAAGIAALDEKGLAGRTAAFVREQRGYLVTAMEEAGIRVYGGQANYIFFSSGPGLAGRMLREGILIRDCRNYAGLSDGYYRIAVRTQEENKVFLEALRRCLDG